MAILSTDFQSNSMSTLLPGSSKKAATNSDTDREAEISWSFGYVSLL